MMNSFLKRWLLDRVSFHWCEEFTNICSSSLFTLFILLSATAKQNALSPCFFGSQSDKRHSDCFYEMSGSHFCCCSKVVWRRYDVSWEMLMFVRLRRVIILYSKCIFRYMRILINGLNGRAVFDWKTIRDCLNLFRTVFKYLIYPYQQWLYHQMRGDFVVFP